MTGYRIKSKRDERLFYSRFKYDMRVSWNYEEEQPVYLIRNGAWCGWVTLSRCADIPVYSLDFNEYYDRI